MLSKYCTRIQRVITRVVGTLCFFGALACIAVVAVGGAFPSNKHGSHIVAPRIGDVWQVGEMHTVQWTLNNVPTTNRSGDALTAIFILSYSTGGPNSHVLLDGHLTDWFPITDKLANIIVPVVPTRNYYSLYLFSHDNPEVSSWSCTFTIFNPENIEGIEQPAPNSLVVTTAPPVSVTMSLASTYSDSELTTLSPASAIGNGTSTATYESASITGSSSASTPDSNTAKRSGSRHRCRWGSGSNRDRYPECA